MIKWYKGLDKYSKEHLQNVLLALPFLLVAFSPMIAIIDLAIHELIK